MTRESGRSTRHSFSFGSHYDQDNLSFGPMVCHDDHLLAGGHGFPDHAHSDLEIVTWVLTGAVVHTDSTGEERLLPPGTVQVQSAGSGVRHSEMAATAGPTRFIQVWLTPDKTGTEPTYAVAEIAPSTGRLVPVVSGHDPSAMVGIGVASATLWVTRLERGDSVTLPDDRLQHVFVATGALGRSSLAEPLQTGDAFRITDQPGLELTAAAPTELLVWTFR